MIEDGAGAELCIADCFFKPLNLLGIWEEPGNKTKRVTAVILLPSGINQRDFSASVQK